MAETLGTIRGQMILDVKQALNAYTQARQANISTVTALHTGAGALAASGAAIAGVGTVMAAGFLTAVDAAAQFERKLDFFAAVSDSTQAEYEAISAKALQLGTDTVFSANEIADSFIELGKSGVSARDIIDGIGEGVAALGAAADIPLDTAANIITSAVATFQLGADQAVHVADQLAGAANASIVDVTDLGTSLKYVGGIAASLKIPFDDVNTALGILGEAGIKGSTAGTSLRQILLGLNGPTKKANKALTELGIITEDGSNKFYTAEGSAKSLSEIFDILGDATAGMSDKQRVATFQQIFATRALPSLIALTRSGAEGFAEMSAAIGDTTAAEVSGKRLDNLSGDIEVLRGNIDTLLISSGSGFQEFSRSLVQGVTQIVQAFIDLPAGVQTGIVAVIAIVGVLLIIIGTLGLFAASILQMSALILQLGPVWAALGSGIGIVTKAVWGFTAALLANPIFLVITLIVALIAALVWFFTSTELGQDIWANFTKFLAEAWTNIVNVAVAVWTGLASFFTDLWNNLVSFFTTWGPAILAVIAPFIGIPLLIAQNWDGIVSFFTMVWTNIVNGVSSFVTTIVGFFIALPQQIMTFLFNLPGQIVYLFGFIAGSIVRIMLMVINWFLVNIPLFVASTIAFFAALPGQVISFFTDLYNGVIEWVTQMMAMGLSLAQQFAIGFVQWLQALPGQIIGFFSNMYNGIVNWLTAAYNFGVATAANIVNGIVSFISNLPGQIIAFFSQVVTNVQNYMQDAYNRAISIASNIYNGIAGAIQGLPGLVSGIFNNIVGAVQDAIGAAFNAVRDLAAGMWEGFKDGLGIHSPSYIEHAMWAITGVVEDETSYLKKQVGTLQGLGNNISEIGNNLTLGTGISDGVAQMQAAMVTAKSMTASAALTSSIGVDAAQAAQMEELNKTLQEIAEKDTINIEKLEISNAEPEPASESLPSAIRSASYMIG